jgi:hypothetical protein
VSQAPKPLPAENYKNIHEDRQYKMRSLSPKDGLLYYYWHGGGVNTRVRLEKRPGEYIEKTFYDKKTKRNLC